VIVVVVVVLVVDVSIAVAFLSVEHHVVLVRQSNPTNSNMDKTKNVDNIVTQPLTHNRAVLMSSRESS
jgi:Na+/H+ antiporter NhaB